MHILIMGGTQFVGRHAVAAALAAGHHVTLFNRGRTGTAPEGTDLVRGDRNVAADLADLAAAGPFDATIDCCAFFPQQVEGLADALAEAGGHHLLVSSISVYGSDDPPIPPGVTEADPVVEPVVPAELPTDAYANYSGHKVACEQVAAARHDPLTIIRPGLVVGPHDHTGRFTYWVKRLAEGGRVLAPGSPDRLTQVIDGRDLGEWMVRLVEGGVTGTYNTASATLSFGEVLAAVGRGVGFEGELVWVADEPLLDAGVEPWSDLPLWLPEVAAGMTAVNTSAAHRAGLVTRPIEATAADLLAHHRTGAPVPAAGITRDREAELLTHFAG